ncbi:armadillo-type protein [Baffinella frigidus]|nr:armadillo-type protein [Cryptophyta sp. CCMP2293]
MSPKPQTQQEKDSDKAESDEEGSDEDEEEEKKSKMLLDDAGEAKVGAILEEYISIHDKDEAMVCVKELQTKFPVYAVSREVVRRGLLMAMDAGDKEALLMGEMFAALIDKKLISPEDGSCGMCSVMEELSDIAIDIPHAPAIIASIMKSMLERQLLAKPAIVAALKVRPCDPFIISQPPRLVTCPTEAHSPSIPCTTNWLSCTTNWPLLEHKFRISRAN